ncbi:hypothetical protein [Maribacter sp. 2210JD10-5]|uniref:hypothetical protein n=1 Tax=Maribacter sp. 2210JD10-5 TaxID=3386272 RepID=UPI0039BC54D2
MNLDELNHVIKQKPSLEFGSIFSRSIDLFQKVWVQGFITLLLTLVTIIPFYVMIYIPLIAAGITDPEMLRSEDPPAIVIISMVVLFPIVMIGIMTFNLALQAAFFRICKQKDMGLIANDDYFYYFKDGRLGKILTLSLIMIGLSILGALACGIGIIYLVVPMSLFPVFLAFNEELSAMEMVKSSFALGNKNWLVIFGLLIVMGFIAELGVILCFVGVLFTAMLAKIPTYFIYKDGVGFSDTDINNL